MKPYKILVVDDYPNMVEMLSMRLKSSGFEVLASYDGIDALQKARVHLPDLILLDVLLPKMDGFKICRLLKFDEKYRHIPIIMLTSRAREVDRETGMEMGANAYMFKPYDSAALMSEIYRLLKIERPGAAVLLPNEVITANVN
jgi:two-component system alkaline phosphatase synthesis response regulator PhoP